MYIFLDSCFAIVRSACGRSAAPEPPPMSRLRRLRFRETKNLLFGPFASLVLPFSPADALLLPFPAFVCRVHALCALRSMPCVPARARAKNKKNRGARPSKGTWQAIFQHYTPLFKHTPLEESIKRALREP